MRVILFAVIALLVLTEAKSLNRRSQIGARGAIKIPKWEALTDAYPQGEAEDVIKRVLGSPQSWITNTCALRMSFCLNTAGVKIPSFKLTGYDDDPNKATEQTLAGTGGFRIVYRVRSLANWIDKNFPKASIVHKKKSDETNNEDIDKALAAFKGKKGIIKFDVKWSDATGHFDLWDGESMFETHHNVPATVRRYFGLAYGITLWEAGSTGSSTVTSGSQTTPESGGSGDIGSESKGPCESNGKSGHCVKVETCKKTYGEGKYNFIAKTDGCKSFPGPVQCCIKA